MTKSVSAALGALLLLGSVGDAFARGRMATAPKGREARAAKTDKSQTAARSQHRVRRGASGKQTASLKRKAQPLSFFATQIKASLERAVEIGDAPRMVALGNGSVLWRQSQQPSSAPGVASEFDVSALGAAGRVSVTALIPSPGTHSSTAPTVYAVQLLRADGTLVRYRPARSGGSVTDITRNLQLRKGANYLRIYPRDAGFDPATCRCQLEINWDGK